MVSFEELIARWTLEAEAERLATIARNWDYYEGRHRKTLRVARDGVDDNIVVNFVRLAVDKTVSYLFGKEIFFQVGGEEPDPYTDYLEAVFQRNRKMTFLQRLALSGAVAGHFFVQIQPDGEFPRLVILDPSTVSILTNPDDIDQVIGFRVQWNSVDDDGRPAVRRVDIVQDGQIWRVRSFLSVRGGRDPFRQIGEASWPYPFPPVVHGQNLPAPHQVYGMSDVEPLIPIQDAINFVISNTRRIYRLHGHPKTIATGVNTRQPLNWGPDETLVLSNENAKVWNLEMQGDLSAGIELYKRLVEAWHEIARIPVVSVGRLESIGSLSGVALRILYEPLLELVEVKRRTYGDALIELAQRLLSVRFGGEPREWPVSIRWPELIPAGIEEKARTALMLMQIGVSQDTLLEMLGFNPEHEARRQRFRSEDIVDKMLAAMERRDE
jgi:hypothetical protein